MHFGYILKFSGLILCSGGSFVALLWSKNGAESSLQDPIPLCIIKTHLKDNKSDFADNKSSRKNRVREKSPIK
jgi:hypothetical protein